MSAVSGIVNTHGIQFFDIAEKMASALKHRGECYHVFDDRNVCLAYNFRECDTPEDVQPFQYDQASKKVLMFSGNIYNASQLQTKLAANEHVFKTGSKAELLFHLYESYGSECVNQLDGSFVFVIYDFEKNKIIIGRDRLGQKPLHYFMHGDSLVFSTELAALQEHPGFPWQLDNESLSNFLSLQYVPGPDSIYRNVRKLPPGHIMEMNLENNNISIRCYWQADFSIKNSSLNMDSATAKLRTLVEKAVEKRLDTKQPLGTFLSGGIDSCIVTGIAAKLLYPAPCDTFTAAFSTSAYDEREAAKISAEIINRVSGGNLQYHEREINADDFDIAEKLSRHFCEPFGDASAIPFYLLGKFAQESISVALCGDGADEIFAGYERYLAMRYAEKVYWMPQQARQILFGSAAFLLPEHGERSKTGRIKRLLKFFASPEKVGYFNLLDRCPAGIKKELFGPRLADVRNYDSSQCFTSLAWELIARDRVEKLEELDLLTYLPGDILPKADIASQANTLELRSPFLDTAVVEFASRLPMSYKLSAKRRKYILCAAFPEFITGEVLARPKRGFGFPMAHWLRDTWKEKAYNKLFNSRLTSDGFIRQESLKKYWQLHQDGRDFSYLLWDLIVLAFFLDRQP